MAELESEVLPESLEDLSDLETGMTEQEMKSYEQLFKENVERLTEIIKNDSDKYYQCVAEIHVLLMSFEASMRGMMMNGGPKSLIKMLMGR